MCCRCFFFFFFNDTATTEIYTLSLHDALPIWKGEGWDGPFPLLSSPALSPLLSSRAGASPRPRAARRPARTDRKSTRLNSSHSQISYAVFCLKKKNTQRCQRGMLPVCTCQVGA